MAYATQDDILKELSEDELLQLADDADDGTIDADVVARAIEHSDATIDGYCGTRYSVPFDSALISTTLKIIRKLSVELSICRLFHRRGIMNEARESDCKLAVSFLKDVARGVVTLGAGDPDGTPAEANTPDIQSDDRLFSRENMGGF